MQASGGLGRPSLVLSLLRAVNVRRGAQKITVGEILEALGERSFGWTMLLFAIVNMLPLPIGSTLLTAIPLIILSLTWPRMSGSGAVAGLVAGALTVIVWIQLGWNSEFFGWDGIYEIIPGFIVAWIAIYVVSLATESSGEFRPLEADRA